MWTGIRDTEIAYSSPSGGVGSTAGHSTGCGLSGGEGLDVSSWAFTFNGETVKGCVGNTFTLILSKIPNTNSRGLKRFGFSCIGE